MTLRLLHYSDVENAYDDPERIGRLAGTIDALRDDRVVVGTGDDTAPGVLALHAEGRQALDFFRAVEPDFETFGNHDFDFGADVAREMVANSPQRWLSANVYEDRERSGRFADVAPAAVVERNGERGPERVGFVGVSDPATPDIASGASDLTVTDPVEAVREALSSLRNPDRVVVLAHLTEADEDRVAGIDAVDAVLGGHVHEERRERIDGTLLLRPGATGRVVWEVELGARPSATRHAVADGPLHEGVRESLRARLADLGLAAVVGRVEDPIVRDRERRYGGECRVANPVTDAYRWATGADVGFAGTGSIREGPPLAGEVTVADLVSLSPFDGELCVVALSGADLRALVERLLAPDHRPDDRTWCGHFAGLRIVYDERDGTVRELRVEDGSFDRDDTYSLATNVYFVQTELGPLDLDGIVERWGVQYDAIVRYARESNLDVGLDGRIRRADDAST